MTNGPEWINDHAFTMTVEGVAILFDYDYSDTRTDWSKVRSPGRARRRMKQGHKQNIVKTVTPRPGVLKLKSVNVAHPDNLHTLARQLREERQRRVREDQLTRAAGVSDVEGRNIRETWRYGRAEALHQLRNHPDGFKWRMLEPPPPKTAHVSDSMPADVTMRVYDFYITNNRVMCGKLCVEEL